MTKRITPNETVQVVKSVNDELKQATFVVLVPDEVDLHGDTVTENEVRKACFNFNKFCGTANLFHLAETDSFEFVESYVSPVDFVLGERLVKKGTWLATVQVHEDDLWQSIKDGTVNGLSIGAWAKTEELED